MLVTREELGRRLRCARETCGLTQQEAAEHLGVPRTAIVQIEAGARGVSSLELSQLARRYGRAMEEFLSEGPFAEDPLTALFRSIPGIDDPALEAELRRCAALCRQATQLEQLLGLPGRRPLPALYTLEAPSTRWDAIVQGRSMARQERRRLDLGTAPVREIAAIVRRQGVRVTETAMPDDISGLFFHGEDLGLVIVVNRTHPQTRRLFSYAHEYAHVLADRNRPGTVSRAANRQELLEVRANTFAAHFLMPEEGVRAFLQSLGKGEPSRQEQEIFDEVEEVQAQKRAAPGSQELRPHDVVLLSHHCGVSFEAALFQLLNLRLIRKERFEALMQHRGASSALRRALGLPHHDEQVHWTLTDQIVELALEAYRRGEISLAKLLELGDEAGTPRQDLEAALFEEGLLTDAVDAVFPG